jgi:hypothetical protein
MPTARRELVVPILLLAFGGGWLLNALELLPGVDWAWSIGLAACGVITLIAGGMRKPVLVVGGFLIVASGLSIARQQFELPIKVEVPLLVISLGTLMLVATLAKLPD